MNPTDNQRASRSPAMDIIRVLACFSVIAVHFLMNSGFYNENLLGGRLIGMVFYRSFFTCCVPLFLLLSGYLLCNKRPERRYYGRIWRILFIYAAASLFCIYGFRFFYRRLCGVIGQPETEFAPLSVWNVVSQILGFEAAPYSWYVEMYLGLFLLIPFLNVLYHGLPGKKQKLVLILSCFILSCLPAVVNVYNFTQPGWWANPAMRNHHGELCKTAGLIPDSWIGIYPLTYYFLGCWLREYRPKLRSWKCALLILLTVAASGCYNLWRSGGGSFVTGSWNYWNSPFNVVLSVLIFIFFLNLDYRRMPGWLSRCFARLSGLTLGAYLVSWVYDRFVYPYLALRQPVVWQRMDWCVVVVPLIFVLSMLTSWLIQLLYNLLVRCAGLLRKRKES